MLERPFTPNPNQKEDQSTSTERMYVLNKMGLHPMHIRMAEDRKGLNTRKRLGQGRKSLL